MYGWERQNMFQSKANHQTIVRLFQQSKDVEAYSIAYPKSPRLSTAKKNLHDQPRNYTRGV